MMDVYKYGHVFNISREVALANGLVKPTAQEAAAMEQGRAKWKARLARAREVYTEAKVALDGCTEAATRAVLTLHAPDETGFAVTCSHCREGDMADPVEWPCETVRVIADVHSIELPDTIVYVHP